MVAVWIILGFLAGFISNTLLGLYVTKRWTKCASVKETCIYAAAAYDSKANRNETKGPVTQEIEYEDYSEKLTLE